MMRNVKKLRVQLSIVVRRHSTMRPRPESKLYKKSWREPLQSPGKNTYSLCMSLSIVVLYIPLDTFYTSFHSSIRMDISGFSFVRVKWLNVKHVCVIYQPNLEKKAQHFSILKWNWVIPIIRDYLYCDYFFNGLSYCTYWISTGIAYPLTENFAYSHYWSYPCT